MIVLHCTPIKRGSSPAISLSRTVSWTAPSGSETIEYYRLEWGTVIDNAWGYFVNSRRVTAPVTSYTFTNEIPAGDYAFRVVAIDDDGEESDPTDLGVIVIP
jgi:Fibronectin type III domain